MKDAELVYRRLDDVQLEEISDLDGVISQLEATNFLGTEYIRDIADHAVYSYIQFDAALDTFPVTIHAAMVGYMNANDTVLDGNEKKVIIRLAQRQLMNNVIKAN